MTIEWFFAVDSAYILVVSVGFFSRDVSIGRESIPITVVSSVSGDAIPVDFLYVSDYVETIPININRVITSLRVCVFPRVSF